MRNFDDLTTGEKSKYTRFYRKLEAERDEVLKPYLDALIKVAEPLWEKRNALIDAEKKVMLEKIEQIEEAFELRKQQIMDEYANYPEYKALDEAFEAKSSETAAYVLNRLKDFETALGLR